MQGKALSVGVLLLLVHWVEATTTVRDLPLPISCSEEACPDRQCWNITLRNPFSHPASWSAKLTAHGASNITVQHPPHTDLTTAEDGEGVYELQWNGSRYLCTDEKLSFVEICISNAALCSTPLSLSIVHNAHHNLCKETTNSPPEGKGLPQFVIISWDDAFTHSEFRKHVSQLIHENRDVRDFCGGHPRHTFFVSNDQTDYAALSHVLNFGGEYSLHTVHHRDVTPSKPYWTKQISAGLKWAERLVPSVRQREEWRPMGVRAPWLEHADALYDAVQEMNHQILYDSSLPSYQQPIWPYLLDNGAHEGCDMSPTNKSCPKAGIYNGLWEFPLNPLISEKGEIFLFDPPGTAIEIWQLLKYHLRHSYEGNRAPMMLSLHSKQFFGTDAAQKQQILRNFFLLIEHEYAARGKTVIFATMRDVIRWMEAGRPTDDKEKLCSFFKLPHAEHAPSPDHLEICDGWDNDGDGQFDEHSINKCRYPQKGFNDGKREVKKLTTCAPCPFEYPTDDGPDEHDDGLSHSWKGRVVTKFKFEKSPAGDHVFEAFITLKNRQASPSQGWILKVKANHIKVTSHYGVSLVHPSNETGIFDPAIMKFENTEENFRIDAHSTLSGIEIGGTVQPGMEQYCIDTEQHALNSICWASTLYLTQERDHHIFQPI